MAIKIEPYNLEYAEKWDYFVKNDSRNGTIFHEQSFLSYHDESRFNSFNFMVMKDGKIIAVVPGITVYEDGFKLFISHGGSSAGGIVYNKYLTTRALLEIFDSLLIFLKENSFDTIEFRLGEPIFAYPTDAELTYLLWLRNFKLKDQELSTCIALNDTEISWKEYNKIRVNKHIDTPLKLGYTVENQLETEAAYEIIKANLKTKYEKEPTHSLEELKELKRRYPERIDIWCAMKDNVTYATVVVFRVNENAVHSFYIAQNYPYEIELLPLVFNHCLHFYKNLKYKWFNFGISSREKVVKWGILEFKEKMGGRAIHRDTWVLNNLKNYEVPINETNSLN